MKAQSFREMSAVERQDKLQELERQLFDLRAQSVTEKLENTRIVKNVKRDIARVKTVIRENQLKE